MTQVTDTVLLLLPTHTELRLALRPWSSEPLMRSRGRTAAAHIARCCRLTGDVVAVFTFTSTNTNHIFVTLTIKLPEYMLPRKGRGHNNLSESAPPAETSPVAQHTFWATRFTDTYDTQTKTPRRRTCCRKWLYFSL